MGVNRIDFSIFVLACDDGWDLQRIGANSYCFKLHADRLNWAQAVEVCGANDSKLPLPKDAQENTELYNYAVSLGAGRIWLDGTDEAEEGVWRDSAGNVITFLDWSSGQPDNAGWREHYLHMWYGEQWNDIVQEHNEYVLCQKPAGN